MPSSLRACSAIMLFKVLHVTLQLCQYAIDQGWRYRLIYNPREVNIFEIPSDPHQRKRFITLTSECKKLPNAPEDDGCPSEIRPFPPQQHHQLQVDYMGSPWDLHLSIVAQNQECYYWRTRAEGLNPKISYQQGWPNLLLPRAFHLGSHEVPETAYEKQTLRFYYS